MKSLLSLCFVAVFVALVGISHAKSVKVNNQQVGVPEGTCTQAGQFLADSFSCDVFYECDASKTPVPSKCADGTCWFEAARECVFIDNCICTTQCTSYPPCSG